MIRQKISLITTVWGKWHTDVFLRLNLRSLLAPSNLPALARMHSLSLAIFTTNADKSQIEQSEAYKQLRDLFPVTFERLGDHEIHDAITTQQRVWSKAIERVNRLGTYLFFLPPDLVWSDASLDHIGAAMARGRRIVIVPWSVRVVSETFERAITAYFDREGNSGIGSRELVRMTLEHLHPLVAAYKRDSPTFPHHTEMLIDTVRGQGLLLRLLASTPTVYEPASVPIDNNKLVVETRPDDEVYIPKDSDEVFVASLAPLGKDSHFFDRPRRADPVLIGQWWLGYPSGLNDLLIRTNYRIHYVPLDPAAWRPAERAFDYFLRRAVIAREGLQVWQAVRKRPDCSIAAEAIAGALQTGTLARAIHGPGDRLVLLPTNKALRQRSEPELDRLMSQKGQEALIRVIRCHMARLTHTARSIVSGGQGSVTLRTDDGGHITLVRNSRGRLSVDENLIGEPPILGGSHVALVTPFVRQPLYDGKHQANPFHGIPESRAGV